MLISIIVPCYNVEAYIADCLHSILVNIPVNDVEIICVDDGSSDGTYEIANKVAQANPCVKIVKTSNGGLSFARNTGLKHARGTYIAFVDGDDKLSDQFWARICPIIASQKEVDIIEFDALRFNGDRFDASTVYEKYFNSLSSGSFSKGNVLKYAHMMVWSRIFKAALIADIRFDEGRKYEDQLFTLRSYVNANVVVSLPEPLYYYRYNPTSITAKRDATNVDDFLFIMDECVYKLNNSKKEDAVLYAMLASRVWRSLMTLYLQFPSAELKSKLTNTEQVVKKSGYLCKCPATEMLMLMLGFALTSRLIKIYKSIRSYI
jgi:glycosyltransferase involved in cell wall biosynthesis